MFTLWLNLILEPSPFYSLLFHLGRPIVIGGSYLKGGHFTSPPQGAQGAVHVISESLFGGWVTMLPLLQTSWQWVRQPTSPLKMKVIPSTRPATWPWKQPTSTTTSPSSAWGWWGRAASGHALPFVNYNYFPEHLLCPRLWACAIEQDREGPYLSPRSVNLELWGHTAWLWTLDPTLHSFVVLDMFLLC